MLFTLDEAPVVLGSIVLVVIAGVGEIIELSSRWFQV
jgi:hypothetical protein